MRKRHPGSLGGGAEGISSRPVLDEIASRVGRCPVDPDGIDVFVIAKVDDGQGDASRQTAGESTGEVRVAFPVRRGIAVCQARIAGAAIISAMRQGVTVGISNEAGRGRRAGEVAFLFAGSLQVPVGSQCHASTWRSVFWR